MTASAVASASGRASERVGEDGGRAAAGAGDLEHLGGGVEGNDLGGGRS